MLDFISTGSAFNVALGNNSACLKTGCTLILIDCGSSIFNSLINKKLLDNIENIIVVITHTHPDHVSSLGDLIFYNHHVLRGQINIIYPHPEIITTILNAMGVDREYYNFVKPVGDIFKIENLDFQMRLEAMGVQHSASTFPYGYIFKDNNASKCFYYSGDAAFIPDSILREFHAGSINFIYQDVSSFNTANNPHMPFAKLTEIIPPELRPRVCCMHLDSDFDATQAERMGFKVAKNQS